MENDTLGVHTESVSTTRHLFNYTQLHGRTLIVRLVKPTLTQPPKINSLAYFICIFFWCGLFVVVAGILYVILHTPEPLVATHADVIAQTLTHLLFLQDPAGNWPSTASASGPSHATKASDLVQYVALKFFILFSINAKY
jgi:hypothetical protein